MTRKLELFFNTWVTFNLENSQDLLRHIQKLRKKNIMNNLLSSLKVKV